MNYEQRINYGQQVMSRLFTPGFMLVVLGAAIVYCSGILTCQVREEKRPLANILVKVGGCVLAIIGALLLFIQVG